MTPVVIDACVARASGGDQAIHPTAKNCRDLLLTLTASKRAIAYSEAIEAEWKKHRSRFAQKWLASMHARKLVAEIEAEEEAGLRAKVKTCGCSDSEGRLMTKDFHLLEGSYVAGGPIISLDDAARSCFARFYEAIGIRPGIHWAHPNEEAKTGFVWLRGETNKSTTRLLSRYGS